MKFKVNIGRTVSETKQYTVEADDHAAATSEAFLLAANDSFNNPGTPDYELEGVYPIATFADEIKP